MDKAINLLKGLRCMEELQKGTFKIYTYAKVENRIYNLERAALDFVGVMLGSMPADWDSYNP
jgi:hypothetical protein